MPDPRIHMMSTRISPSEGVREDNIDPELADMLVGQLVAARAHRTRIAPLTRDHRLCLADAYTVQARFVEQWCTAQQTTLRGFKISLTSRETQAMFDATEPSYGALFTESVIPGGSELRLAEHNTMLVEPELVFILERDLAPGAPPQEIAAASLVAPALELPESRYADWFPAADMRLPDMVADCAAGGFVVVGEPVPAASLELGALHATVRRDDQVVSEGMSANVLGHPLTSVAWLTTRLAASGIALRTGDVISSGTFAVPQVLEPGRYEGSFDRLGRVSVTLT